MKRNRKKSEKIRILKNGKEQELDYQSFVEDLGVDGIIRITSKEYKHLSDGNRLGHFNLEASQHKVGSIYALPRILRNGYFKSENDEHLPLLSFEDLYYGKCIEVKEDLDYEALDSDLFRDTYKYIKDTSDLKREIFIKYTKSLPLLGEGQMTDLGISYTLLEISRDRNDLI